MTAPVDERVPLRTLGPLAVQHLLVMITGPISSAFLIGHGLALSAQATTALLATLFLLSAIGTALQSFGPLRIGARLPFVMLPGGAAVVLFIQIAQATDPSTATGAVLITGLFILVVAPLFTSLMRWFPPVVLGAMVMVIGVNLVRITAALMVGQDGKVAPSALGLAAVTVLAIVLFFRFLPDPWRRVSVLLGIVTGTAVAAAAGALGPVADGPLFAWPQPLPFGPPAFDLLATLPLLLFGIGAMAEATGQTVLNADATGTRLDRHRHVTGTIRGDAVASLLSGLFGGPLMVTSGENIGIVRLSGVRSRYVTAATALLLAVISVLAPVGRWISAVPAAVVAGAGVVVFAMITVLGVRMLAPVDLGRDGALMTATVALVAGLLPVLLPAAYQALPAAARLVLGSGVTMAALGGVLANLLFRHLDAEPPPAADQDPIRLGSGTSASGGT